jgi:hypothetical protein
MVLAIYKKDPRTKLEKQTTPSPPLLQNLKTTAAENTSGDETTWGEVNMRCHAEVEEDHLKWLSIMEE